jgi:hypothetical protein
VALVDKLHESHRHVKLQITREVIPTRLIFYFGHGTSSCVKCLNTRRTPFRQMLNENTLTPECTPNLIFQRKSALVTMVRSDGNYPMTFSLTMILTISSSSPSASCRRFSSSSWVMACGGSYPSYWASWASSSSSSSVLNS